jgi:hypothetical protein
MLGCNAHPGRILADGPGRGPQCLLFRILDVHLDEIHRASFNSAARISIVVSGTFTLFF